MMDELISDYATMDDFYLDSIRYPLIVWRQDYIGNWHKLFESSGYGGVFLETAYTVHLIFQSKIHALYREG